MAKKKPVKPVEPVEPEEILENVPGEPLGDDVQRGSEEDAELPEANEPEPEEAKEPVEAMTLAETKELAQLERLAADPGRRARIDQMHRLGELRRKAKGT